MPTITYVEANGTEHTVEVEDGHNLMEGATLNMVPGIDGVCGGMCACATCHCYIEEDDAKAKGITAPEQGELDMLAEALDRKGGSRLSCQVTAEAEMDGLRVYLPEAQVS